MINVLPGIDDHVWYISMNEHIRYCAYFVTHDHLDMARYTAMSAPEKLAQFVRSLPDFVVYEIIDGHYNHMGATVADAVLQANLRYSTHVKPRVNRILQKFPEARKTNEVILLLDKVEAVEILNWRGEDRAKRFCLLLNLFAAENIETENELRDWLLDDDNLPKLRAIRGVGPKTVDYFKILVGISTSAIDRHLLNFLELAGLKQASYTEAQNVINEAADILGIGRAYFDHSIWQYMTKKSLCTSTDK